MVRLEPHVMNKIQELSEPAERGRGGGVSQYLRRLVYDHLGLGDPPCFATGDFEPEPVSIPLRQERHAAPELA